MKSQNLWMLVSGACGFFFFVAANTNVLRERFSRHRVLAGILQLSINTFVFLIWGGVFLHSVGFKKFFAFFGAVVPPIMAGITIWRVFLPRILAALSPKSPP